MKQEVSSTAADRLLTHALVTLGTLIPHAHRRTRLKCRPCRPRVLPAAGVAARSWTRLSDEELLGLRFCDLKLSARALAARAPRAPPVRASSTSAQHRFQVRTCGLSEEWFSPDGVPGIAVPFYLAHPRLERLERRMMREPKAAAREGRCASCATKPATRSTTRTGCAVASAGAKCSARRRCRIPTRYRARPGSRRYVHHLGEWYAQAHPTEDFAETFAVWLKPNSDWRRTLRAAGRRSTSWRWSMSCMTSVRGARPPVRNRDAHRAAARRTRARSRITIAASSRRYSIYRRRSPTTSARTVFTRRARRRARAPRACTLLRAHSPRW